MSGLVIRNLCKIYDRHTRVLNQINLDVMSGEFVVLVGPSGCGKSTLLRMIAGLEDITSGQIEIDGKVVNDVEPADRDIAMVFQDYALYPHMTVRENMSFGLKIRKVPQTEINKAVDTAAAMLNIEQFLDRKPSQLSGGQRQRVAIGRAIVRKPKIFLFDEPLSNLDAKLRVQTRVELAALHKKVGSTAVYVTHDQVEAMTLADRIVVLNKGDIQQVGAPMEVYDSPANMFVASFIGSPSMNFFPGQLKLEGGKKVFEMDGATLDFSTAPTPKTAGQYILGLRPEALKVLATDGREAEGTKDLYPETVLLEPHGHESHLVARIGSHQLIIRSANPKRLQVMSRAKQGDKLATTVDRKALHWFEATQNGKRVSVS